MQAKIVLEWDSTSTLDSVVEMEVYNDLKRQRDRWSSCAQKLMLRSLIPAVARHTSLQVLYQKSCNLKQMSPDIS